jgi:hypothetical protein
MNCVTSCLHQTIRFIFCCKKKQTSKVADIALTYFDRNEYQEPLPSLPKSSKVFKIIGDDMYVINIKDVVL